MHDPCNERGQLHAERLKRKPKQVWASWIPSSAGSCLGGSPMSRGGGCKARMSLRNCCGSAKSAQSWSWPARTQDSAHQRAINGTAIDGFVSGEHYPPPGVTYRQVLLVMSPTDAAGHSVEFQSRFSGTNSGIRQVQAITHCQAMTIRATKHRHPPSPSRRYFKATFFSWLGGLAGLSMSTSTAC